jgi:hypothetical protein
MATSVKRLRRDAGSSLVGYVVLLAGLTVAAVYFSSIFTSINNTNKSGSPGYTTVGGACSQGDSSAGVFAKVEHAANCK